MTDDEHLRRFEDHSLPRGEWNHHAHLRIAYLYLTRYPYAQAVARMRAGVRAYNAAHGIVDSPMGGYHETLTCAWLQIVAATLHHDGPGTSADAFLAAQTHLGDKHALLRFYSRERLWSPAARVAFIAPDLAPLPQMGIEAYNSN
jgi:hypothetical protein